MIMAMMLLECIKATKLMIRFVKYMYVDGIDEFGKDIKWMKKQ